MNLEISVLAGTPRRGQWITKPFLPTPGFDSEWWVGDEKSHPEFCSFSAAGLGEVARAQVRQGSAFGVAYPTYSRPRSGATEIERLEIRAHLRGRGLGHEVVAQLLAEFPGPWIVVSLNDRSDRFWRSLRWCEQTHPTDWGASLFVWPD